MLKTPWKVHGICLSAPMPEDLDLFEDFVEKKLVPGGCNLIIMLIRYRYQFKTHPECASPDNPLNEEQVKRIVALCRRHHIRLIPKMNLLGHQSASVSENSAEPLDGLLRGHPELDENFGSDQVFYCRSLCPGHPDVSGIVFDLMDEMVDVFEADGIHIGMDEIFHIGECERCRNTPPYQIFAAWLNQLAGHNRSRNIETFMWGDRLLNSVEIGYSGWEASANFTNMAIGMIPKDIVICDWHYEEYPTYPSVKVFAEAGFRILVCPWRYQKRSEQFIDYAKANDSGHIEGVLASTWVEIGELIRYMSSGQCPNEEKRDTLIHLAGTLNWLFSS